MHTFKTAFGRNFTATVIVLNENDRKDTVLHCNTDNAYVLI